MPMREEGWDNVFAKVFGLDLSEPLSVHPLDGIIRETAEAGGVRVARKGGGHQTAGNYVIGSCEVQWVDHAAVAAIGKAMFQRFEEWSRAEDAAEAWENEGGARRMEES